MSRQRMQAPRSGTLDLIPDISFRAWSCPDLPIVEPVLELSEGTAITPGNSILEPRGGWRRPHQAEAEALVGSDLQFSTEGRFLDRTVACIRIPEDLRRACARAALDGAWPIPGYSQSRAMPLSSREEVPLPVIEVFALLRRSIRLGKYDNAVLLVDPADQAGTTMEKGTGRRVGLHVDNFDPVPPDRRHTVDKHLCINLGDEVRFLLVVPLTLLTMSEHVEFRYDYSRGFPASQLGRCFLERHQNYPVCRLTMLPGYGYIAPAQDCMHDGSTKGTRSPDIVLALNSPFETAAGSES